MAECEVSSSSFRRGRGQLPPSPGWALRCWPGRGRGRGASLLDTTHRTGAATREKGAWHQTVYIKVGLTFDVLCRPVCRVVWAVLLSPFAGGGCNSICVWWVCGGGRPAWHAWRARARPGHRAEHSPGPARDTEQLQLAGGAGRWQLGALTRSRSQSATSPGTWRTGPGTQTRPRHPPLSRSGSRHGHAVTVQHTDTCECWGAVLISSLHHPSPGRPGSRLLSLLCAICQARVDNLSPPPFTSCQW